MSLSVILKASIDTLTRNDVEEAWELLTKVKQESIFFDNRMIAFFKTREDRIHVVVDSGFSFNGDMYNLNCVQLSSVNCTQTFILLIANALHNHDNYRDLIARLDILNIEEYSFSGESIKKLIDGIKSRCVDDKEYLVTYGDLNSEYGKCIIPKSLADDVVYEGKELSVSSLLRCVKEDPVLSIHARSLHSFACGYLEGNVDINSDHMLEPVGNFTLPTLTLLWVHSEEKFKEMKNFLQRREHAMKTNSLVDVFDSSIRKMFGSHLTGIEGISAYDPNNEQQNKEQNGFLFCFIESLDDNVYLVESEVSFKLGDGNTVTPYGQILHHILTSVASAKFAPIGEGADDITTAHNKLTNYLANHKYEHDSLEDTALRLNRSGKCFESRDELVKVLMSHILADAEEAYITSHDGKVYLTSYKPSNNATEFVYHVDLTRIDKNRTHQQLTDIVNQVFENEHE